MPPPLAAVTSCHHHQPLSPVKKIDRVKQEMEAAERDCHLNRVAELKYGTLMTLQLQLEEAERNLSDYQHSRKSLFREEVTDMDIAEIVSKWTGIPLSNLQQSERDKLVSLEHVLHKRVIGQDMAVKSVTDAIRRVFPIAEFRRSIVPRTLPI
ncbi:hypothetical protein Hanom_Chr11g01062491 [Helianthus anomalus]